jgi:hypothetical protein
VAEQNRKKEKKKKNGFSTPIFTKFHGAPQLTGPRVSQYIGFLVFAHGA